VQNSTVLYGRSTADVNKKQDRIKISIRINIAVEDVVLCFLIPGVESGPGPSYVGSQSGGARIVIRRDDRLEQQIMLLMWEPAYQGSSLVFKEDYTSGIF
jgi:hypothetical protein